jgi:hypothetical protein
LKYCVKKKIAPAIGAKRTNGFFCLSLRLKYKINGTAMITITANDAMKIAPPLS